MRLAVLRVSAPGPVANKAPIVGEARRRIGQLLDVERAVI
jgi:hypothetical protein